MWVSPPDEKRARPKFRHRARRRWLFLKYRAAPQPAVSRARQAHKQFR
jgi:hypothetical protein